MSLITVVTTVVYAVGLPIFVEAHRFYYRIWDVLIKVQQVLIELSNKYLWPWMAELLKLINFESIKILYNDINEKKLPEQCVREYIDRAGPIEYAFIIFVSTALLITIAKMIILPLEDQILMAPIMMQFVEKHPMMFRIFFCPFLVVVLYLGYMMTAYIFYILNQFNLRQI